MLENPEPFIVPNNTNNAPHSLRSPVPTVTGGGRNILAVPDLVPRYGERGGGKAALIASFLQSYYGAANRQDLREPLRTIPTHDRFGLVTVEIAGEPYVIVDIAMRMLQPRELYRAQGFPDSYTIDRGADGRRLTKTEQVRMVGNSVCPQVAAALVRANVPEMIARDEVRVPMRRKRAMATA